MNTNTEELQAAIMDRLVASDTPGVSVALLRDGVPVVLAGVGFRDADHTEPVGADDRMYLYSITKVLLATVALQLADAGRMPLDAPVAPLLTEVPLDRRITLRHLLGHTAGLPDYGALPAYAADLKRDPARLWTDAEFLERTLAQGPRFAPGEGWAYSNIGFLLVRHLIEQTTGQSLHDVIFERIVAPLGLRQTAVVRSLAEAGGLTPGWGCELNLDDRRENIVPRYDPGWVSHGVVASNAHETALMLDAVVSGRLVSAASRRAMLWPTDVPGSHPPFRRPAYGLGVMLDAESPAVLVAGHGGGGPGFATAAFHVQPDNGGPRLTAVALTNSSNGPAQDIAFMLLRASGAAV